MNNSNKISTFGDFWPAYLREHSSRASRAAHIAGIAGSLALAAALLSCGMVFFLVLAIVPAQLGAWLGHKLSFRHAHGALQDTASHDHPDWAALADLKMFGLFVTGKLNSELARAAH